MTELERAKGGKDIADVLELSLRAYNWLDTEYIPESLLRLDNAQRFLKKLFMGESVKIDTFIPDLEESICVQLSAWVAATSKNFYITDTRQFSQIKDYCDSFAFNPQTDGTISIVLYINDIARRNERR